LYEIAALLPPFKGTNHLDLANKILEGKFIRLPMCYSEDLQLLCQRMININPEERPSVDELMKNKHLNLRLKEVRLREKGGELKKRLDHRRSEVTKVDHKLKTVDRDTRRVDDRILEIQQQLREA
jgi:serine/threonine protein kinase